MTDPSGPQPSDAVSALYAEKVKKLSPRPWYLFHASMHSGQEHKYYELCVAINEHRGKIKEMMGSRATTAALEVQRTRLRNMEVTRQHLATVVEHDGEFRLLNGSLVSSFFATFALLDRELPVPSRYVPQDFTHRIPFLGATTLEEPVALFQD